LSVVRGKTPTTNDKDNVQDLFSNIFHRPLTLQTFQDNAKTSYASYR
jgi:hypothetical protein